MDSIWSAVITGIVTIIVGFFSGRRLRLAELRRAVLGAEKEKLEIEKMRREHEQEYQRLIGEIRSQVQEIPRSVAEKTASQLNTFMRAAFDDHSSALEEVKNRIRSIHTEKVGRGSKGQIVIKVKLIGVSLKYSWEEVFEKEIKRILQEMPNLRLEISVLFNSAEYLKDVLKVSPAVDNDWCAESLRRIADFKSFKSSMSEFGQRLVIHDVRTFDNILPWHGWLIDDHYLYLGRTKWDEHKERSITVGQNKYRFFSHEEKSGLDRINLFKSWFNEIFRSYSKSIF